MTKPILPPIQFHKNETDPITLIDLFGFVCDWDLDVNVGGGLHSGYGIYLIDSEKPMPITVLVLEFHECTWQLLYSGTETVVTKANLEIELWNRKER